MSNRLSGSGFHYWRHQCTSAATAQLFIKEGAQVVITVVSCKGQDLAETLGQNASYHEADITQEGNPDLSTSPQNPGRLMCYSTMPADLLGHHWTN